MSPIDSGSQAANFHVFQRRKKYSKTNTKNDTKSDAKIINIQEEPSEEKGSQEQATMILTGNPTNSFPYVEEKTRSHMSSTSQIATQENIFSRYREIKKKNEALKATIYSEFWNKTATNQHKLLSALDTEKG